MVAPSSGMTALRSSTVWRYSRWLSAVRMPAASMASSRSRYLPAMVAVAAMLVVLSSRAFSAAWSPAWKFSVSARSWAKELTAVRFLSPAVMLWIMGVMPVRMGLPSWARVCRMASLNSPCTLAQLSASRAAWPSAPEALLPASTMASRVSTFWASVSSWKLLAYSSLALAFRVVSVAAMPRAASLA